MARANSSTCGSYIAGRKLETPNGRWNGAGMGGKEMWPPVGIWEPLLRFIGVGILWTWGIIHGKASLSGPVYKMRQGWQRWRPSTTEPSCLNMRLSHLTYPKCQEQPFSTKTQDWHGIEEHRTTIVFSAFSGNENDFFSLLKLTIEDFISMRWLIHRTLLWTTEPRSWEWLQNRRITLDRCLRSHGNILFIQQFPESHTILCLVLLDENTRITFSFINDSTLDERCRWKSATSVCCIHFSAGSTYSSCLMMLIHSATFTDKCVFGYIHHPEWVFLMSHPLACFTLSSMR